MSGGLDHAGGQHKQGRRLPALALSWLLLLVAALAALSCSAAGDGDPTAMATGVPSPGLVSPTAGPTPALPSPTVAPTPAAAASPTASRTASPTLPAASPAPASPAPESSVAASPAVSPTVESPSYACPPNVVTGDTPVYGYRVLAEYPHDQGAFTQGLVYTGGILYEGTGLYGGSSLRKVDLETGQVLQSYLLPREYFGEGIAIHDERILQLTWQNRGGFIYDRDSFDLLGTFSYPTEGWGLTHDGTRFIMSDGTATLHFWHLQTLEEIGQVQVHDENGPVACLNELEYVDGQVYANVWQTDYVAVIDPASGQVTAWLDLAGLLETTEATLAADVLNGIAYDVEGDRLFVTGKWWPRLFEIELVGPLERTHLPQVSG
ncbi:MAG TPA: glutaminyl-peptide cyclotransferase [Anaerolineae bacterium]|nr:glutaminyl-peptide cyclotransferase [Anaerolineae bacterium]